MTSASTPTTDIFAVTLIWKDQAHAAAFRRIMAQLSGPDGSWQPGAPAELKRLLQEGELGGVITVPVPVPDVPGRYTYLLDDRSIGDFRERA